MRHGIISITEQWGETSEMERGMHALRPVLLAGPPPTLESKPPGCGQPFPLH